ncbi:phosphopantetheine-binding protein [Streptomyces olivaceus]|uniref:phosphopantetheine-binding protein n=1 Tax=Streptomyces olivaceus TaxID=47716 RepID=UPI0033229D7A
MNQSLTSDRIRADVAEIIGCDVSEIGPGDDLFDLGLDSVRLMTLVERWRSAGAPGLELPDLAERPEVAHWITVLTGEKPTGEKPTGEKPTGERPTGEKLTGEKE